MAYTTRRAPAKRTVARTPQRPAPVVRKPKPSDGVKLTDEQLAIKDVAFAGEDMSIQAGAGSGKSFILAEIAADRPNKKFLWTAYNRAAREDMEKRAPKNMVCKTRHAIAYGAVGWKYRDRIRTGRIPSAKLARHLKIFKSLDYQGMLAERRIFKPADLASMVLETVDKFCTSDAAVILPEYVPWQPGLTTPEQHDLAKHVAGYARRFWLDTIRPSSQLEFRDDYYFKLFLLGKPSLPYDACLVDEAQDSNSAMRQLILGQHMQRIAVGDAAQSLYQWNGAINILDGWPGQELFLTTSFRFGQDIADEANMWLEHCGTPLRLKGNPNVTSRIAITADEVDAVLCRTNGKCISEAIEYLEKGYTVGFSKDPAPLKKLASAVIQLKEEGSTNHEDLAGFDSWDEVVEYSDSPEGSDLSVLVQLVNRYSARRLWAILNNIKDASEEECQIVVATAHSTKGLEWDRVKIASDFKAPNFEAGERLKPEDAMVYYVAVTRARKYLNNQGLEWGRLMPSLNLYVP